MNYFSDHWDKSARDAFAESKLEAAMGFLRPLLDASPTPGRRQVFDAGCGNGIHAAVLCGGPSSERRFDCVGLDISHTAVFSAQQQCPEGFIPVCGDMMKTPFPDGTFDAAIAFGSLAYTPDPPAAFQELVRVTKPGGVVGIWMMEQQGGLGGLVFSAIRTLCRVGGAPVSDLLAAMIIPFLPWIPTKSGVSLRNASWKQCKEVVLVNIAPPVLHFYRAHQVREWFNSNGVAVTHEDPSAPLSLWGVKRNAS